MEKVIFLPLVDLFFKCTPPKIILAVAAEELGLWKTAVFVIKIECIKFFCIP